MAREDETPSAAGEGERASPSAERSSPRAPVRVADAPHRPAPEAYPDSVATRPGAPPAPYLPPVRPTLAGIY